MKSERRRDLLRILQVGRTASQEEIVSRLNDAGHSVTQGTVSRDLKEIGALKLRTPTGVGYRLPDDALGVGGLDIGKKNFEGVLTQFVIDVLPAASIVVLKTVPGYASAVGRALDLAGIEDVVGTIAGDDTVFVAAPSAKSATKLASSWLETDGSNETMEVGA
ncbi:MAG: transcriptional regulator of arginine metabolism [Actinomycetota bacterium]|nr:transcriptional regulator of arginine metabolism [Actinomycetota bacterium]